MSRRPAARCLIGRSPSRVAWLLWIAAGAAACLGVGCGAESPVESSARSSAGASSESTESARASSAAKESGGLEPLPSPEAAAFGRPASLRDFGVRHARRFGFETTDAGTVLWVREPWRDEGEGLRYLLVPRDQPRDESIDARYDGVIEVPIERLVTTSTTELGHLVTLGLEDLWVGHAEPRYVCSPSLRARIDAGAVVDVSAGPGRVEPETLLAARPDVLLADFAGREQLESLEPVRRAGVVVILAPSFLEPTPLGRAEWVRVLGALGGRDAEAAAAFAHVEASYEALRAAARPSYAGPSGRAPVDLPVVVTGGPFDGVWHVPGGDSYAAHLLADAGAAYPWSDVRGERSLPLDLEAVIERAAGADLWLWPSHWSSRAEILAADSRLGAFEALRSADVWAADRRTNGLGGNDYWESGAARPELVLADLLHILDPSASPDQRLFFHRRLDDPIAE